MLRRSLLFVFFAAPLLAADPPESKVAPAKSAPQVKRISGPYSHANLSLYLLHGPDVLPNRKFLTLDEALEQKKIIVHETSNVSQLAVENTAADVEIFIHTGDIVKGGKQDRLMAMDLIVPPKSGKVPVPSFCVEAGRWTERGGEDGARFSSSKGQIPNDVKKAVNIGYNQSDVWKRVKSAQEKLSKNVGRQVTKNASPSSLQLTLEDKALIEKLAAYEKALTGILKGHTDAIGLVVVINGKVDAADVYASSALFAKLWPKLMQAATVDALAEFDAKKKFETPTAKAVEKFLADASAAPAKEMQLMAAGSGGQQALNPARQSDSIRGNTGQPALLNARTRIIRQEAKESVLVESRDKTGDAVLHRSYLRK